MSSPCILIVEDDANLRKTLHDILALKGYAPVSAATGEAALAAAQTQPPAAAVIDLKLADLSGLEVLRQLKALSPAIECLVVTGYGSQASAIEAVNLGAYSYFQKPYNTEQLLTILRRALERREAAEALRASEARYRTLIENVGEGIGLVNADECFLFVNPAGERLFGAPPGSLRGQSLQVFTSPEQFAAIVEQTRHRRRGEKSVYEIEICRPDGEKRRLMVSAVPQFSETGEFSGTFGVFHDITEREQMEEALRHRVAELEALHTISAALRSAKIRDEVLPILLDETLAVMETEAGIIWLYDPDTGELRIAVSRGWFNQLDEAPMKPGEGIAGAVFASGRSHVSTEFKNDLLTRAVTRDQVPPGWGGACVPIRGGTEMVGVLFVSLPLPHQITPEQVKLLESVAEMAGTALHRMSLYEETRRQLDQLQAVHNIDLLITASMDLRGTLSVLLEHVVTQLKVDATDVLLFNPYTQMLTYAARHGFRTGALIRTGLRLGEGYAGRAGLEQKLVHIPDLRGRKTDFLPSPAFSEEGFVAYYGMPLIVKGQLKGVLEVFDRAPLARNSTWLSFFETLAGQAAIAIDNTQLLANLRRSHADLALAYDTTIEGWSRALDLRDRETEGHTLRVTEITLRLAHAAGIGEAELVHIRRGALLHDIGKMGVPDGVLLKPDKLTDDEWVIMRQHPQLAFDMLAPIAYLKPALDIPVCHHEKWDGTGYPRGLKGEQIPLAARLFAVVDVWDALRSDRPYRAAWPEEQVLEHIRSLAGTHFDPQAVVLFLGVMSEKMEEH